MAKITRFGANLLMVAIAEAVTGAMRLVGIDTRVPYLMRVVFCAARAIVA